MEAFSNKRECRALKTATGAAGYFPQRGIVFRPRPAMDTFIAQKWAQKKPLTFGNGVAAYVTFSASDLELPRAVGNVKMRIAGIQINNAKHTLGIF